MPRLPKKKGLGQKRHFKGSVIVRQRLMDKDWNNRVSKPISLGIRPDISPNIYYNHKISNI